MTYITHPGCRRAFSDRILTIVGAGLLVLLLAACPQLAMAQTTNTFPASGPTGIGTTGPQNPLTIARSGSAPWATRPPNELLQLVDRTDNTPQILFGSAFNGIILRYTGTDGTATNQRLGIFTGGGGEAFVVNNDGNVGIGTTAPTSRLEVKSTQPDVALNHTNTANYSRLLFKENGAERAAFQFIGSSFSDSTRRNSIELFNNNGAIAFFTHNAGAGVERMRINANGNVGVGTPTPSSSYKLDVNGNTNVTGNLNATGTITGGTIQAKYQDVAEWVESSQTLAAGTVVVLDQTKSNQVIASSQAYDTRVAGVISLQPGITLGERGTGKVLVATTGRVKVKVDATAGPIRVGDLLVTADKEGVAKKSEPLSLGGVPIHRPGTLIGKALEPLEKGTGEILVLLSLQ